MIKRNLITISILMLISLICGFLVLNIEPSYDSNKVSNNTKSQPTAIAKESKCAETVNNNNDAEIGRSEEIRVYNNASNVNFNAWVYENSLKKTFLKFEYSMGVERSIKEYDSGTIPELQDMFEKRDGYSGNLRGNRVREVYLNPKYNKAYFVVEGKPGSLGIETVVFSFNYKDASLTRLIAEVGRFTELSLSNDLKYVAFSYSDLEEGHPYLQIIQCDNDKMLINKNKLGKEYLGRNNASAGFMYAYGFLGWKENNNIKLNEIMFPEGLKVTPNVMTGKEVLYDIEKNILLNPDGSGMSGLDQTGPLKTQESGAIKSLKNFYEFIATNRYNKAYDLLDTKFRITAFKEFGIGELSKADIDVDKFAVYGSFFKMAKLDYIVQEKVDGNNAQVYFYQTISTGKGIDIQKPLIAQLKKVESVWKILEVTDGNPEGKPFKQN